MNILERIKHLESKQEQSSEEKLKKLSDRIEKLENIIEAQGYYIP